MSPEEIQNLKLLFVATSMYYGHEIPDEALKLYVSDLEDLPFAEVAQALKDLRREVKTTRCPLPAVIRAKLDPTIDPEAHAALISNEIVEAIGRVGPYRIPELSAEAREVVRLEGGWQRLCDVVTNDNLSIYKAQWRQLAKAVMGGERSTQTQLADQRKSRDGELTAIAEFISPPGDQL